MAHKILMIDDDQNLVSLVRDFLEQKDCQVDSTERGSEGIEKAKASKPDLILLDVQLLDMQGWEVCQKIKSYPELENIPILMISGVYKQAASAVKGLQIGAVDYLPKPFNLGVLWAKLEKLFKPA
ncbi:MAG: response regulator [Elusimicrobia bacterium]|nr:response regulator [Elusimicrobiota bacterium]